MLQFLPAQSEVPFISFLRLVHFRITFADFVFSGLWRCDQACINDSTAVHDKTGFVETAVYICKDLPANPVLFKHMAKLGQRCSVSMRLLKDRCGFPGQGRLIDHPLAGNHHAVKGNDIAHTHYNLIADCDIRHRHQYLLPVLSPPYFADIEGHAPGQVAYRLFMRPFFQKLTNSKQEHDGACRFHVAAQYRNADCRRIQNRHLQFSAAERFDSKPDITQRFQYGNPCPDRIGNK